MDKETQPTVKNNDYRGARTKTTLSFIPTKEKVGQK